MNIFLSYHDYIPNTGFACNGELVLIWEEELMHNDNEPLLDRKSAAKYLRVSPGTLAVWDCTKRYDLKPIKIGRAVRYRRADLDKFIEQRLST